MQDAVHRAQQRGPRFVVEHDDDAGGGEGRAAFELLVDALRRAAVGSQRALQGDAVTGEGVEAVLLVAPLLLLALLRRPLLFLEGFAIGPGAGRVLGRSFQQRAQLCCRVEARGAGASAAGRLLRGHRGPDLQLGHGVTEVVHGAQHQVDDLVLPIDDVLQPGLLARVAVPDVPL